MPGNIISAYKLIAHEIFEQIDVAGRGQSAFTHVMLQVGVGSFAMSIVQYLREHISSRDVHILTIEPAGSACLLRSMERGVSTVVSETAPTVSVGLDCGAVNPLAWPVLRDNVDTALAITDDIARDGVVSMHILGLVSGESGAACAIGALRSLFSRTGADMASRLGLTPRSHVLVCNTEGVTAPDTTEDILKVQRVDRDRSSTPPCPESNISIHHNYLLDNYRTASRERGASCRGTPYRIASTLPEESCTVMEGGCGGGGGGSCLSSPVPFESHSLCAAAVFLCRVLLFTLLRREKKKHRTVQPCPSGLVSSCTTRRCCHSAEMRIPLRCSFGRHNMSKRRME